ncbi:PIN domain-containing protein [Streptomyces xinghaiensis]|uniref:PIN domain-containing protein n=1 Tax=Streptomyces xinghaiensis TaxID=1038928 RepID=UPI002E109AB5|nr:PIN domain-containing protein [Streptomyces xinghaiensis]
MIVVLDTTAFSSDFMCSGTAWRVLAHASRAWGLQIYVPEVVVAEAIGGYEREISNTSVAIDKVVTKYAGRLGLGQHFGDFLENLQDLRNDYPERLARLIGDLDGAVLPPPEVSHMELAKRAASRRKPCDHKGDGYRDTLNWLLVLQLAQESPEETIFWVTDNSTDFANEEKDGFRGDLLEDIAGIDAVGRVHWANDLSSLLLSLAASHYDESADDLRNVRDGLQQGAIAEFIGTSVLPGVVKKTISARRCGLPLLSVMPEILAVQGVGSLELDVKGVAEQGGAFAEFSFTAEALIGLDLVDANAELPEGLEWADGVDRKATVLKELSFRGLIQLDLYGRPVSGEVSNVDALSDDPGLEQWKRQPSGLASLQAALSRFQHHTLMDPSLLHAMRHKLDPKVLDALRPNIDPKIFGPKIDPKVFDFMLPKIDPQVLELMRPKIDPKIFEGILSSLNPLAGIAGSSALAAIMYQSASQADSDGEDADLEENKVDGDEDAGEADA